MRVNNDRIKIREKGMRFFLTSGHTLCKQPRLSVNIPEKNGLDNQVNYNFIFPQAVVLSHYTQRNTK